MSNYCQICGRDRYDTSAVDISVPSRLQRKIFLCGDCAYRFVREVRRFFGELPQETDEPQKGGEQ